MKIQQAVDIKLQTLEGLDAVHGSLTFFAFCGKLRLLILQICQVLFRLP